MGNHLPDAFLFTKPTYPSVFALKIPQYQGFLVLSHALKLLFGTYPSGKLPTLRKISTYIKKYKFYIKTEQKINRLYKHKANRQFKNAAVLKGIAAFFHSTNSYELAFVSANKTCNSHFFSYILRQAQAFLFRQAADKFCYYLGLDATQKPRYCSFMRPGCRSPPTPFRLPATKKSKRRKD